MTTYWWFKMLLLLLEKNLKPKKINKDHWQHDLHLWDKFWNHITMMIIFWQNIDLPGWWYFFFWENDLHLGPLNGGGGGYHHYHTHTQTHIYKHLLDFFFWQAIHIWNHAYTTPTYQLEMTRWTSEIIIIIIMFENLPIFFIIISYIANESQYSDLIFRNFVIFFSFFFLINTLFSFILPIFNDYSTEWHWSFYLMTMMMIIVSFFVI